MDNRAAEASYLNQGWGVAASDTRIKTSVTPKPLKSESNSS